jgi:hypothetical protein
MGFGGLKVGVGDGGGGFGGFPPVPPRGSVSLLPDIIEVSRMTVVS